MSSLQILVAYRRYAELCVLDRKSVMRRSQVRTYPKPLAALSGPPATFSIMNSSHCCEHKADPLIQSP